MFPCFVYASCGHKFADLVALVRQHLVGHVVTGVASGLPDSLTLTM